MKRKPKEHSHLNKDEERRDMIIFGEYDPEEYLDGVRWFNGLTYKQVRKLLRAGFIKPLEKSGNLSRGFLLYLFMKKYPDYKAHGYVDFKDPKGITIEGVSKDKPADTKAELMSFLILAKGADRVEIGAQMYCEFEEVVPF